MPKRQGEAKSPQMEIMAATSAALLVIDYDAAAGGAEQPVGLFG